MENETIRKIVFIVAAVALLGLGIYSTVAGSNKPEPTPTAPETPIQTVAPETPSTSAPAPVQTEEPVRVKQPISDAELVAAATAAQKFLLLKEGFNYRDSLTRHVQLIDPLVSNDAQFDAATLVPSGELRDRMTKEKTTITAKITFDRTTMVTTVSAAFLVTIDTTTSNGIKDRSRQTITMVSNGSGWKVLALDLDDEFGGA